MKTIISRLWSEQDGAIVSAEIMLVATILVIGMIVGLKSVRDAVVSELADVAQAFGNINQSFCYSGVSGHMAFTAGSEFVDLQDFSDGGNDANAQNSKCVNVCIASSPEGMASNYGRTY
jgi:Flp pilus assembly pilin Flp